MTEPSLGRRLRRALPLGLLLASLAGAARADDATALPAFMRDKPRIENPERKEEGNFFTPLPVISYDPSVGLGLGAAAYFTMDGRRTDPLFAYTPYVRRFYAQVQVSTGGYQQHQLRYDSPYVLGSPFRIRASLTFERNPNANYFGVGAATLGPLSFEGRRFATADAEAAAASALDGGVASPLYNHYLYDTPSATVSVDRDFLGGRLRAQYGLIIQWWHIERLDGHRVQGIDGSGRSAPATEGPTLLGLDCAAHVVRGCDGGWLNMLKAGVTFDTRDFEPDPRSGVLLQATGEWSTKAIGSSFETLRLTLASSFYVSPIPSRTRGASPGNAAWTPADVTFAGRVLYSMQSNDVPFFGMNTLALTEGDQQGLGGERTLRGYRQNRFVGRVAALINAEIRWSFVRFPVLGQHFSLQVAPFFDTGRVFDQISLALTRWKPSAGGGLRIGWDRSTIIMLDVAKSPEDAGFYIDLDMPY